MYSDRANKSACFCLWFTKHSQKRATLVRTAKQKHKKVVWEDTLDYLYKL